MKPSGKVQGHGRYSDPGSFSTTDRQRRSDQAPGPRVHGVVRSVASILMRSMVQFFEGIKTRVADYKFQKASGKLVGSVMADAGKNTDGDLACKIEKTLPAAKQFTNAAGINVGEAVHRFLDELDEMDTEDYEALLIRLTAMTPDIDPVRERFHKQVVATLRAGIGSDMDRYALRALDGLVPLCGRESIRIIDVAGQHKVFSSLSMRSKMMERHPETVSATSFETDRSIQRWFERQGIEVQEDLMELVSQIAGIPMGADHYLAQKRLHAFCIRVLTAIQASPLRV